MTITARGLIPHRTDGKKPITVRRFVLHLAIMLICAAALRILLALPALSDSALLVRPDSMGYWNPAAALANGDGFVSAPGSSTPEVVRTIGYPLVLAGVIKLAGESMLWAALTGIWLSASTVIPIAWAVSKVFGVRAALLAGWLWSLNITAIAAAPMILADTLIGVLAAWQMLLCVYFVQEKKLWYLAGGVLLAIAGALVKPVNLPVVIIGMPIIALAGFENGKKFAFSLLLIALLIGAGLVPYWVYNYRLCGDYEGNSANMYFHNGSAVMARVTGESSEVWRQRLLKEAGKEFAGDPEKYRTLTAQNKWKKAQFVQMVKKYPFDAVITHLPNIFNLLPDVPTMLENNRLTVSGRGTMAVLRQEGLAAAVQHYLNGRWYLLLGLLPLLAVYAVTVLLALWQLLRWFKAWQWRWLLVFGVLVFYYIWAPGPVISARYLLPALPMIIFMASNWKEKKVEK